ncbi:MULTISPECIES: RdgB/HAM1 family non-canonical purine NTP pyrophosphatase [Tissierellales]|jgi:XTP/dITP diphosphohydrolase|uniref:dITP/XTP pyrophosphatase n=1 Tax=Acidilutibacter cellobiosedens TaxID=2507161 RepID=A0A410QA33_9FIRM|nr:MULTISPECIES: RdgB/HAM1 family non-canonical purine NTP pyrophosphatase [Tissierellales]MBE6081522.1 RdgB/HAM1 family non-canonical purine NTP pyrophosphatase [Tissierellaceae bacterium]QAT60840.1 RdgB/HAM1 family non-canonical purine NTP pyrophosphatase [Acidilutibacter cellobiosedens]SCL88158.1 Non-canonical purine NTP pyrophosphatase [Sporanaerobacter sp. PP17-6a]
MERRKLILSTGNIHKVEEIKDILDGFNIEILSKDEIGLKEFSIEENGTTLEENAIKKATEIQQIAGGIVIADDTGLFVDKLNGEPGLYSARYSGEGSTYRKNNKKLLNNLKGVPLKERNAVFKTVIAITDGKRTKTVTGECRGKIGFEERGTEGFGYDPLFIVDGYDRTFAELGEEIKNKISHRSRALKKLKEELKIFLNEI